MNDLISRQAAIDMIRLYREDEAVDLDELESSIALMPSTQPEIIRCKDCKHYTDAFPYNICEVHESEATDPEDFCSYGD